MRNLSVGKAVVGFIGTGVMGRSMAGHLLDAGYEVVVYNRTKEKAADLLEKGAVWGSTPGEVASKADVVFTIVGYPQDVEEVYFGKDGLIERAEPGTFLVDMTTSSPLLAERIYAIAKEKGLHALDAPVSGGDIGAREARLSIMGGGDDKAFEAVRPLFEKMGTNIVHQGKAGAGQHTKMCNQITIASNMIGVSEAVSYAKKAGLDPERVLESITAGAAASWSLSNLAPRMIKGDFAPGFYVKHFIKDLKIALDSAKEMELQMPGVELAHELYKELAEKGGADNGTQALIKLYDWLS